LPDEIDFENLVDLVTQNALINMAVAMMIANPRRQNQISKVLTDEIIGRVRRYLHSGCFQEAVNNKMGEALDEIAKSAAAS